MDKLWTLVRLTLFKEIYTAVGFFRAKQNNKSKISANKSNAFSTNNRTI